MTTAAVVLWGTRIGAVTWEAGARGGRGLGFFEYDPDFQPSGIEVAPLTMPLGRPGSRTVHSFPTLGEGAFRGLPGLLADSLPDRFGSALIDAWLRARGRRPGEFDPVERLCYVGRRGMGALEYEPATFEGAARAEEDLDVAALVELASLALSDREAFRTRLAREEDAGSAVRDILRVGTSAGGARAKAVIAWNPGTGQVRSGQVDLGPGFEHWILKFDGVSNNVDHGIALPLGFGRIEYAYSRMARDAGIVMEETRLLEEGGRAHFLTKRFDRPVDARGRADKLHVQTLGALAHLDYDLAGAHSCEEALGVARRIGAPAADVEQLFLRMVFNLVTRNQDDHVKNIAFQMDRRGRWRLAPAYDLTFAYNPDGAWTSLHQMTLAGKRDRFEHADLVACARTASLPRGLPDEALEAVLAAAARWPEHAEAAGVPAERAREIGALFRTAWPPTS